MNPLTRYASRWLIAATIFGCAAGIASTSDPQQRFRAALVGAVAPIVVYFVGKVLWMAAVEAHRRRWLQFNLRNLLFAMVVIGIELVVWDHYIRPKWERQKIASVVAELGGVSYDDGEEFRISIGGPVVTDDLLAYLATLPGAKKVTRIKLSRSASTGPLLVTDAGMIHLTKFPKLESVSVKECQITNKGLEELRAIPSLKSLDVSGCPHITDDGVTWLAERPRLRLLNLMHTQVTLEKMEQLKAALHNCTVVRNKP